MNTIKDEYENFENMVIAKDAPEIRKSEMKLVFYAGVYSTLILLRNTIGDDSISEDASVALLTSWLDEAQIFIKQRG